MLTLLLQVHVTLLLQVHAYSLVTSPCLLSCYKSMFTLLLQVHVTLLLQVHVTLLLQVHVTLLLQVHVTLLLQVHAYSLVTSPCYSLVTSPCYSLVTSPCLLSCYKSMLTLLLQGQLPKHWVAKKVYQKLAGLGEHKPIIVLYTSLGKLCFGKLTFQYWCYPSHHTTPLVSMGIVSMVTQFTCRVSTC